MAYTTAEIRNLALVGHAGAGKTALLTALLRRVGVAVPGDRARSGDEGAERGTHTLETSLWHFEHEGRWVHLVDTPGYPDLLGRSQAVLPAVDTAVLVVNAVSGVEIASRRMMQAAAQGGLDRIIVINRIDQEGADLPRLLSQLRDSFGAECLPINLPCEGGRKVVDCFFSRQGPPTDFSSVEEAHRQIIEQVIEVDPALLERYLGGDERISAEQLHDPFEKALREGHLIPVCFTSAATGAGIDALLELILRLLPNPIEANPPPFLKGEGEAAVPVNVIPHEALHPVAHVFRVGIDPYQGRIAMMRVHQGTLKAGAQLFAGDARKPFKLAHLYRVQGGVLQEIALAIPGDLVATTRVEELHYDAVVHASHDEDHHHLQPSPQPSPMHGVAIAPARQGDEQKLADCLHRLLAEDPSLRLEQVPSLNETVLYGLGDMHLRVALERMRRQYNVELKTQPPSIPYRETILGNAEGHHRHKKQTGGAGQFGEVFLRVEPLPRGAGFEFVDAVKGGVIPGQFIPAVEKGVRQAMDSGAIAGYPLQDLRVTVYDGKTHPVDSKEVAFVTAGRKAFLDAVAHAHPILLEPIVDLAVTAPASALGAIAGELSALRGRILSESVLGEHQAVIEAQAPLGELRGFEQRLKAQTAGEGTYTLQFSHYEQAPPKLQQELMALHARRHREEVEA